MDGWMEEWRVLQEQYLISAILKKIVVLYYSCSWWKGVLISHYMLFIFMRIANLTYCSCSTIHISMYQFIHLSIRPSIEMTSSKILLRCLLLSPFRRESHFDFLVLFFYKSSTLQLWRQCSQFFICQRWP
jgi:hypothetical protein